MALILQPEEADIIEEDGVFFQSRGAVCFTAESQLSPDAYKDAGQVLAVSARHGIIILSDPQGEQLALLCDTVAVAEASPSVKRFINACALQECALRARRTCWLQHGPTAMTTSVHLTL